MSIIIGLDIALNNTGWCRIDTENGARTLGSVRAETKGLMRIAKAIVQLVDLCRNADLVVMEGLSMGLPMNAKGRSFVPQGRNDTIGLTYLLRIWLFKANKLALLVPPTTLKKYVTDKGNCAKNIMLRAVSHRWGVEAEDDNQADALALAEFGRAYLDKDNPLAQEIPAFQALCLTKAEVLETAG